VIYPIEFIVQPNITYILFEDNLPRRIYTDGRSWPAEVEPSFAGYSIGHWVDEAGDGRFNLLEIETRYMKGPRTFEGSGLPLHEDNQTIVKERIYLDKSDPNLLHNEITTIDNALTRPWVVTKEYRRTQTNQPIWWKESVCAENNVHVTIGNEVYYLSGDGLLMPSKKGQPPPDLRYFKQPTR